MTDPSVAPWALDGPFTDDDLAVTLASPTDAEADGDNPVMRWTVTDDGSAEWAMARVAAAKAELAALAEQADEWATRIQDWFDHRAGPLHARLTFFEGHLERYALAVREASGAKTKSVTLPSGTVRTTSARAKAVIVDVERVTAWALQHLPEAVQHKVGLTELRAQTLIVEVPTRLVFACGCIIEAHPPADELTDWLLSARVGGPAHCADCGDTTVADWADPVALVIDPDGKVVPGVTVDPGGVTAKVSAK